METNRITDTLKKTFPHWTEKQVSDFLKFLSSCFRDLSRSDEHIVLSTLNDSIIKVIQKYDIPSTQPGRLRTIYRRNMLKLYNKKSRTPYFDGIADYLGEQFDGLDQVESIEKINRFFKVVRSSGILTDALEPLCDHIEIVARKMLDELGDGKEKWSRKDFWEEVEQSLLNKGVTLTDVNYRQLQKRLRDRITGKRPDAEGLLHLAQKNTEEANALQILYAALTAARSRTDYLQAYRFTVEELDKMKWLKKEVFENNGFKFEPNRFPEVYYGSFEEYKSIRKVHDVSDRSEKVFIEDEEGWKKIADAIHNIKHSKEKELTANQIETLKKNINPDALGFYVPDYTNDDCRCGNESGKIVKEGYIILFKERIEELSETIALIEGTDFEKVCKSIRFNVLMHELGHWITHWAWHLDFDINVFQDINWKCNYYWNSLSKTAEKKTHEALAQLITYWSVLGNNFDRQIFLDYFTPTDPLSEYRLYLKLIDFSKNEVLNKTKVLRTLCDISDEIKERYLSSDSISFHEYLSKELFNEIRNQPCNLGDGVQLSNIEATNKKLLLHMIKEINKLKTNTSIDSLGRMYLFQKLYFKMEKGEEIDVEIKTHWNESKKYFGTYDKNKGKVSNLAASLNL